MWIVSRVGGRKDRAHRCPGVAHDRQHFVGVLALQEHHVDPPALRPGRFGYSRPFGGFGEFGEGVGVGAGGLGHPAREQTCVLGLGVGVVEGVLTGFTGGAEEGRACGLEEGQRLRDPVLFHLDIAIEHGLLLRFDNLGTRRTHADVELYKWTRQ